MSNQLSNAKASSCTKRDAVPPASLSDWASSYGLLSVGAFSPAEASPAFIRRAGRIVFNCWRTLQPGRRWCPCPLAPASSPRAQRRQARRPRSSGSAAAPKLSAKGIGVSFLPLADRSSSFSFSSLPLLICFLRVSITMKSINQEREYMELRLDFALSPRRRDSRQVEKVIQLLD